MPGHDQGESLLRSLSVGRVRTWIARGFTAKAGYVHGSNMLKHELAGALRPSDTDHRPNPMKPVYSADHIIPSSFKSLTAHGRSLIHTSVTGRLPSASVSNTDI